MPDETMSPATGEGAPQDTGTPAAATPPPASPEPVAAPAASQEPDIESLLKSPEYRKKLLEHPELQTEFQRHRSEGGRRAKAELEQYQRQMSAREAQLAEQQRQAELSRIAGLEDDEAGALYKRQLAQQQQQQAMQQYAVQFAAEQSANMFRELVQSLSTDAAADFKDLTPDEQDALNPVNHDSPQSFIKAWTKIVGQREARKLAGSLAKKEAEAIVQERLGQQRDESPKVPSLPAGAAQGSGEFIKDFATGKSNDMGRAKKLLQEMGLAL